MGQWFSRGVVNEKDNFCKFGQGIVGPSSVILRDILESYIPCTDLLNIVNSRPVPLKLTNHQRQLIMSAATDGYQDFDITLLYTLLRNICSNLINPATPDLPAPTQGWGKDPLPSDITLSDDIERIRILRNRVFAHLPRAELTENEYKTHWGELTDLCKRCKHNTRLQPFGHDYEQCLKDLEYYKMTEKDIKDITDKLSNMQG